jgi:hypothetical protein
VQSVNGDAVEPRMSQKSVLDTLQMIKDFLFEIYRNTDDVLQSMMSLLCDAHRTEPYH